MGPVLLIDKSTFQSLSRDEHAQLHGRFLLMLAPVLFSELIADLTKEKVRISPENEVLVLAAKFLGSGSPPTVHFRLLCADSLLGQQEVPMDGRMPVDRGELSRGPDGAALFIDLEPENKAIMRWARGEFLEQDWTIARNWRKAAQATKRDAFIGSLEKYTVIVPRAKNATEIPKIVDTLLENDRLARPLIDWLMDMIEMPTLGAKMVRLRWQIAGRPFRTFAPYGYHCARALLALYVAVKSNVIGWLPNHMIDLHYLYYLPFCMTFTTSDKALSVLAPPLLRANQTFIPGADLKRELKLLADRAEPRISGYWPSSELTPQIERAWSKVMGRPRPDPRPVENTGN